jgi:hypothetical protein
LSTPAQLDFRRTWGGKSGFIGQGAGIAACAQAFEDELETAFGKDNPAFFSAATAGSIAESEV